MFPPQVDDIFGIDLPNNDGDPRDDNQHGTHVAGILGAIGNNNIGIAGAASYTQNIKIMAIKFLDNEGGGDLSDAILGIEYVGTGTGWLIRIGPVSDQCHRVMSPCHVTSDAQWSKCHTCRMSDLRSHVGCTVSQSALRSPCHSVNSLDINS